MPRGPGRLMDPKAMSARLDKADQYHVRKNGFDTWEAAAPAEDVKTFYDYLNMWLKKRQSGATIGWKSFAMICREDIPSFELGEQALLGALRDRIRNL